MVREAKKSHDLLSPSWRTLKVSSITQSKGLRTREAHGIRSGVKSPRTRNSEFRGQVRMHIPDQKERVSSSFSHLFFHFSSQWIGWCLPALVRVHLFTQPTENKCSSLPETSLWTHPEIIFAGYLGIP